VIGVLFDTLEAAKNPCKRLDRGELCSIAALQCWWCSAVKCHIMFDLFLFRSVMLFVSWYCGVLLLRHAICVGSRPLCLSVLMTFLFAQHTEHSEW